MPPRGGGAGGAVSSGFQKALAALADRAAADRLALAGVDPAAPATPEQTRAFLAAELAKFRDIVRRANLQLGQ